MARLRGAAPSRHAAELPYDLVAEIARAAGGKGARSMRLTCRRWRVGVSRGARTLQVRTCFSPWLALVGPRCRQWGHAVRVGASYATRRSAVRTGALHPLCTGANAQPLHVDTSMNNQPYTERAG